MTEQETLKICEFLFKNLPQENGEHAKSGNFEISQEKINEANINANDIIDLFVESSIKCTNTTTGIKFENVTWRQHVIQQEFLKLFMKNNYIYLSNVKTKKINKENGTKGILYDTYIFESPDFPLNFIEEIIFSQKIESDFTVKLPKLINQLEKRNIIKAERMFYNLIEDYLYFYFRSPFMVNGFYKERQNVTIADSLIYSMFCGKWTKTNDLVELMINKRNYKFAILKNKYKNFLLSDSFISTCAIAAKEYFADISNREIGLKETIILFPVSPEYYIILWNSNNFNEFKKEQINILNDDMINKINSIIWQNSYETCICNDETTLNELNSKNIHSNFRKGIVEQSNWIETYLIKNEIFFYEDEWNIYNNKRLLQTNSETITIEQLKNFYEYQLKHGRYKSTLHENQSDDNYMIRDEFYIAFPKMEHAMFIEKRDKEGDS